MINKETIHHAAFWDQDCCTACGRVVEQEEGPEVIFAQCPLCESPTGRWNAGLLDTLMKQLDEGEEA